MVGEKVGDVEAESMSSGGGGGNKLILYVAGQTPKSMAAIANLHRICAEHMPGRYDVEVIDLKLHPHLAKEHSIVALPTLVRKLPIPLRKIIGDLSDTHKVLVNLRIEPE